MPEVFHNKKLEVKKSKFPAKSGKPEFEFCYNSVTWTTFLTSLWLCFLIYSNGPHVRVVVRISWGYVYKSLPTLPDLESTQ